jgi:hypothetical protein
MSPTMPNAFSRLRAANPARPQHDRGESNVALAALERILADPGSSGTSVSGRRVRSPRGLVLVLAALVLGTGGALATTDPFGWWSANPDTAQYRINPALHVRTPSAQVIACRPSSSGDFRCVAGRSGRRYMRIDTIQLPGPASAFTRAHFNAAIRQALAAGTMPATQAAKFRADVAAVPDSFFTELQLASHFATVSGGGESSRGELVPPAGVHEYLVCETAGAELTCGALNGNLNAPIGAGVYAAETTSDWRLAPRRRRDSLLPQGINFTPAEYRVLIDIARNATGSTSSSSSSSP